MIVGSNGLEELLLQGRNQERVERLGKMARQMQTSCPSLVFSESYITTYNSPNFAIIPTLTTTCGTRTFQAILATVTDLGLPAAQSSPISSLGLGFAYVSGSNILRVQDWSRLGNNTYYNISLSLVLKDTINGTQVTVTDNFVLVVGQVSLFLQPLGLRYFNYRDTILVDYSTAFDPMQPETAALTSIWTCGPWFQSCSALKLKGNQLSPTALINTHRIVYDQRYLLNVTIQNPNVKFLKSSSDASYIYVISPQYSEPPLSCLDFRLVFKNTTMPFRRILPNEREILFDNNNYTDVVISGPSINLTQCTAVFGSNIQAVTFTVFNNTDLFDDYRSYYFNTSGITIPKARIQKSFINSVTQKLTSYAYLQDKTTLQVLGYQYQVLTLQMSDQTLYARTASSFVQADSDKLLYIDGGSSYDLKPTANSVITYSWTIEGFPAIKLPGTKVLTLAPDQRAQYGVNQPGRYYSYLLVVSDQTRQSLPTRVNVQISPGLDPLKCITLSLKDINIDKIIAYTNLPLLLQVKVTKNGCTDLTSTGALVWSCDDVKWQFWQIFFNNNTIGMDRLDIQQLPKSRDIEMSVTQFYRRGDIEYKSILNFVLFVERPDLVPIVTSPTVFSPRELTQLVLDASSSYDPQSTTTNTSSIPIACTWDCPAAFLEVCTSMTTLRTSNGCTLSMPSTTILNSTLYTFQISGNMHLFKLKIMKDSRVSYSNVYITVVDSSRYPKCAIRIQKPFQNSINQYLNISSSCTPTTSIIPSKLTYLWSVYQWDNQAYVPEIIKLQTDSNYLRVPPYILGMYRDLLIQLMVTADVIYTTPVGMYYKANDQTYFKSGTVSLNFNSFTSYLSNLVMTPSGWDSGLSSELLIQYRYQESDSNYRVIMAPVQITQGTSISTILPPFTYDEALYIDVIDTLGNYITIRQPMLSEVDVKMTATQFAIRVNAIIQNVNFQFNEADLEANMYKLRQYFAAYRDDSLNLEGMPVTFFKILSENTLQYLYNTFYIDKRLSQVLSSDRRTLINQHVIDIVHAITKKHRSNLITLNFQQGLILVYQIVSQGNFTLGNTIPDITSKIFQIAFQSVDLSMNFQLETAGNVFDLILGRLLGRLQTFLYPGEQINSSSHGFQVSLVKIGTDSSKLPDVGQFSYDKAEVFRALAAAQNGGIMVVARNDTYSFAQVYDKNLNQLSITKLATPVRMTFKLGEDYRLKYANGTATIRCASRDKFSDLWASTRITLNSVNNQSGEVQCTATHFTQYTLFIVDKVVVPMVVNTTVIDPTNLTNKTVNDTQVTGKWNTTIKNDSIIVNNVTKTYPDNYNEFLFEDKSMLMYMLALGTLVFFIFLHIYYKCLYKSEHKDQPQRDTRYLFVYNPEASRWCNLLRLYWLIILNFNPYLNLCMVYNKFLLRWVRNLMIQSYFLTVSLAFGINSALLSLDYSDEFTKSEAKIGLFFIIISGCLLLRPLVIKFMYGMLYEPHGRVENYKEGNIGMNSDAGRSQLSIRRPESAGSGSGSGGSGEECRQRNGGLVVDLSQDDREIHGTKQLLQLDSQQDLNKQNMFEESKRLEGHEPQSSRGTKTFGFRNQPQSFLPSIFDQPAPNAARHSVKITSFEKDHSQDYGSQKQNRNNLPSFTSKINGFKEMANAFDEIIIDGQEIQDHNNFIEAELDRLSEHEESHHQKFSPPQIAVQQQPQQEREEDQEIKFELPSRGKQKPNLKKKKKKDSEQKDQMQPQVPLSSQPLPPILGRFAPKQAMMFDTIDEENQREMSQERNISEKRQGGFAVQFYKQNNEGQPDNDGFNEEFEGGDQEESKGPQDKVLTNENLKLQSIEPFESLPNEEIKVKVNTIGSPTLQVSSGLVTYSGRRFIGISSDSKNKVHPDDEITEHVFYDKTPHPRDKEEETLNPSGKKFYLNKVYGKTLLLIIWVLLILGNLICLVKMRYQAFRDWCILSVSGFFAIVLIIDPILYLILACVMIKPQTTGPQASSSEARRGSLSRKKSEADNAQSNDLVVEYFTGKNSSQGSGSYSCSKMFVSLLIGKEKMKDLRRRLNPYSPI